MKKILFTLFALLPTLAFADNELVFKGTITDLPDSCKIALWMADGDRGQEADSILVSIPGTENFTIKTTLEGPAMLQLFVMTFNKDYNSDVPVAGFSFMAGNETVELPSVSFNQLKENQKGNLADEKITLKAGKLQGEYKEYLNLLQADKERYSNIWNEGRDKLIKAAYGQLDPKNDSVVMYNNMLEACQKSMNDKEEAFIKEHPTYAISALLTSRKLTEEYKYTAEQLDALAKQVEGNEDTHRLAVIAKNLERAKKFTLGSPWGNEAVTMADGEVKTLQQLVNKDGLTLFDCWASWCRPCRMAIPKVKAIAEKYASRLKVNSISCDRKEADWRKAMEDEKMSWPQAIVVDDQLNTFMSAYNINTIPRLILIKDNKIVVSTSDPDEIEAYIEADK